MNQELVLLTQNEELLYKDLLELPKHKLVKLVKYASKARKEKYDDSHKYRYGNLPRSFTKKQFKTFIKSIWRKETKRIFLIQYFYALRIGELYHIEILPQGLLKIYNEKKDRFDYTPIHGKTKELFKEPLILPHIDNLRKTFRKTIKRAGLEYIYYDEGRFKLRQFTPHSLRHTAITKFMNIIKSELKTMKFGRWKMIKGMGQLPTYYHYDTDLLKKDLEETFKEDYKLIELIN